ncbi:MAG: transglycosylase domain-containing protein [Acidobacteriota bacterium]
MSIHPDDEGPETEPSARRLRRRAALVGAWAGAGAMLVSGAALLRVVASPLEGRLPAATSWLYARPLELRVGAPLSRARLREEAVAAGYAEAPRGHALEPGRFRVTPAGVEIHVRRHPTARGVDLGGRVEVRVSSGQIVGLRRDGERVRRLDLEPVLLAAYLDEHGTVARPLRGKRVPEHLIHAVLAAEDERFFRHAGLSAAAIARAAWANLRAGGVEQGGSTITQQLVKNLYLDDRRTAWRKAREALLAVAVEVRHGKREILEAYLDVVYLGTRERANIVGVGAAARAFFGKDAADLTLGEAATLAGMIASPGRTSPVDHPGRARQRRDWVLARMAALGWVGEEEARAASAAPLHAAPEPINPRRARYFAEAVRVEARHRYGVERLEGAGLALFSTLDWRDQREAESAVTYGLDRLERAAARARGSLQAALVSIDPHSGSILAWVGGRDFQASQFDRAGRARRQPGSAFKPVVLAAAFERGVAAPATIVADEPLSVSLRAGRWSPRNDDGDFLGMIPLRAVVEASRNVPIAALALDTGLDHVVATARALGLTGNLPAIPALALGAVEVTPAELAGVYAALAAGGLRAEVHGLGAIVDAAGAPLVGTPLPPSQRVLGAGVAFLVNDVLVGVVERGTGRGARAWGLDDPVAGKTGTSNERRDAWFCGASPERATVVWVGRDDDQPAEVSGARAALPVWARFSAAVRPPGGYSPFPIPDDIVEAVIDPRNGKLATDRCPEVAVEKFIAGTEPRELCPEHGGWLAMPVAQPDGVEVERPGRLRRWLARVFGRSAGI